MTLENDVMERRRVIIGERVLLRLPIASETRDSFLFAYIHT